MNILSLPSVLLSSRFNLPCVSGIYFVLDKDNNLLYLGRSRNINARWQNHHRYSQISGFVDVKIHWLEIKDIDILPVIESQFIASLNPILNNTSVDAVSQKVENVTIYEAMAVLRRMTPQDIEQIQKLLQIRSLLFSLELSSMEEVILSMLEVKKLNRNCENLAVSTEMIG